MLSDDPKSCPHLEELLCAYALNALDEADRLLVEAHLFSGEGCPGCRRALAELQQTAALLGGTVGQQGPPASLRPQLMAALRPPQADRRAVPARSTLVPSRSRVRLTTLLVPLAGALVAVLFAASLVLYLRTSQRMDRLERQNDQMTAELAQLMAEDLPIPQTIRQLRAISYWMASPNTQVMDLQAMGDATESQGVLLVSGDGRRAILMVAGMEPLPSTAAYQVWLMRDGQRLSVGQVRVDPNGWGTAYLRPAESVFQYNWVRLTREGAEGAPAAGGPGEMVLAGRITTKKPAEQPGSPR